MKKRSTSRSNSNHIIKANIDSQANRRISNEIGETGLYQYGGVINEEILRELSGVRGVKIYYQMANNDPTIGALLFAVDQLIRSLKWKTLPSDSSIPESVKNAAFIDECRHDMSDTWEDTISSIMSFLIYGFSIHEIVYKLRDGQKKSRDSIKSKYQDGKIGWKRLPIRSQESILQGSWVFSEEGADILAVNQFQVNRPGYETIPWEKLLHFKTINYKNNPQGKSILRNSYRPWHFKRNIENIEGIGIERELAGLPIIKAPAEVMASDATTEEKAMYESLKEIVSNVRKDEQAGIVLPSTRDDSGHLLYELTLLSSNGAKMFDTNKIIERYRNEILSTVIADFITLGQGVAGTQALAETKVELFLNAIESWVGQVESVFNRFAIPRLLELNGITTNLPTLQAEEVKQSDVDQFSKNLLILSQAGMDLFPSDSVDEFVRNKMGLPAKSDKDDEWFQAAHEAELESLIMDQKLPKPNINDTTGATGAEV